MQLASLLLKIKKGDKEEGIGKLVFRKAKTGGKNRKILQKNKLGSVPVY